MAMIRSMTFFFLIAILTFSATISKFSVEASDISKGALERNGVPCNSAGANQQNCKPGKPVNKYDRGCNMADKCRNGGRLLENPEEF